MPSSPVTRAEPHEVLKRYFGYDSFRANQESIVDALLEGRDVLAVMPTGAGKSICYQVPALCLEGVTVVVSPLISLMKDQVNALTQAGVQAAYLNSALSASEREDVLAGMAGGAFDLLYVAPERLEAPEFVQVCRKNPPALVAVDEAHCISQWGQDFRPSYTRIKTFVDALPQRPPLGAFTATATRTVRDDIRAQLQLVRPLEVVASFDRPNLHFEVRAPRDKDEELLGICRAHGADSGIVYCTTRRSVEEVYGFLNGAGVRATRYHAGLSTEERKRNQDAFIFDDIPVIVATNAFGMGIDKSNVSFVVHYNMPRDLESYYQEAGRAGRDGEPADCVMLYAKRDVQTCRFLIERSVSESEALAGPEHAQEREQLLAAAYERLKQMTFYATTNSCLRAFILRYFGEDASGYCGSCGNCEKEYEEIDATLEAQKLVSCVYRLGERRRTVGKTMIIDILRGSKAEKITANGYDTLSTYGIMAYVSMSRARFILDALLEHGLLAQSGGQYPVVEFTGESARFLREKERFVVKVPKDREPAAKGTGGKEERRRKKAAAQGGYDEALFEKLRSLRLEIAQEEEVAAFIVFSNAALADMCRKKPVTRTEFLQVSGVGEKKANAYGERFCQAIADYVASGGEGGDGTEGASGARA